MMKPASPSPAAAAIVRLIALAAVLSLPALLPSVASACDPLTGIPYGFASLHRFDPTAAATWDPGGTFSQLVSLPMSNYDSDCNPWVTPDERQLFFVRINVYGPADSLYQGDWDMYVSEWDTVNGHWGPGTNLGPNVNSTIDDRRPTTTASGDTLVFSRGGTVYLSIRSGGVFGTPSSLFSPGTHPMLTADYQHIYYERGGDIWVCDQGPSFMVWVNHRALGSTVNTTEYYEVRPYVSPDDSLLFFSDFGGNRPGGFGGTDLFVSKRTGPGDSWGTPERVPAPVNTDLPLCTAHLMAGGKHLYVSSEAFEGSRGAEDIWITYLDSLVSPTFVPPTSASWTKMGELNAAWNVYELAVDGDGILFAATSPNGRVFRSVDDGMTWVGTAPLPGAMIAYSLLAASDGKLYVGTYPNGDVFWSDDKGTSWNTTSDMTDVTAVRGLIETSDGKVIAGTSPDAEMFSTTDAGSTWTALGSTFGFKTGIMALYEVGPDTLLAGSWGIGPNRSVDGGATWSPTTLEGFTSMSSANSFRETSDGTLWATGWLHGSIDGGQVWKSTNRGFTWNLATEIEIGPVRPTRVYDLVETDDGALVVGFVPGAGHVAAFSIDGGAEWHGLGELPGAREILRFLKLDDGTIFAATAPNGDVYRLEEDLTSVHAEPTTPERPGVSAVLGGYPNPFTSSTRLRYQIASEGEMELAVVDATGRLVRTIEERVAQAGFHEASWDGRNRDGRPVADGIYFARLRAGGSVTYQKLVAVH